MLTLIIAEAELERIPQQIASSPFILRYAHQKGKPATKLLLDSNYHHAAMKNLPEDRRRGRPDITHLILLTALESILNKQGRLQTFIHTRNDEVITVNPQTRIMRSDERFAGLLESLFDKGVVPDTKNPLLSLRQQTLSQLLGDLHPDYIIMCSSDGTPVRLHEYFTKLSHEKKKNIAVLVGGFPSGSYRTDLTTLVNDTISLYPETLAAWTVVAELLVTYETTSPTSP